MKLVPVIISGGAGSRLWPLSREQYPKPFIPLPDGGTLIGRTFARAAALPEVERVVTVTNRELLFLTTDEYEAAGRADIAQSLILEPFGRDTAPAIALACLHLADVEGGDAVALVMPADHLVTDQQAFGRSVAAAQALAGQGRIVVFGVRPDAPETGFGYLEADGDRLRRFVEKPDAATAAEYVASGRFFWNAGIFCFRVSVMLAALERHCPDVLAQTRAALAASHVSSGDRRTIVEIDRTAFAGVRAVSVDYAVMEHVEDAGFVPAGFDWSDIGSWNAIAGLVAPDADGNRLEGDVIAQDARDCFVHGRDRVIGLVGVSGLLVVDTPDALLICRRDRAQETRAVYNRLKARNSDVALFHRTAHRPWGTYTVLEEGPRFKIKRIEVKPGGRLSLQAHRHRSEHWVVVSGTARVTNGDREITLVADQSTYIPLGHRHRLENPGQERLVMIEVQSGDYLGEDDIERFDDVYGRVP